MPEPGATESNHDRRKRTKVRVRNKPPRHHGLKKAWPKHKNKVIVWGTFALAVLTLFVLVYTGFLRAPAPLPPPE